MLIYGCIVLKLNKTTAGKKKKSCYHCQQIQIIEYSDCLKGSQGFFRWNLIDFTFPFCFNLLKFTHTKKTTRSLSRLFGLSSIKQTTGRQWRTELSCLYRGIYNSKKNHKAVSPAVARETQEKTQRWVYSLHRSVRKVSEPCWHLCEVGVSYGGVWVKCECAHGDEVDTLIFRGYHV